VSEPANLSDDTDRIFAPTRSLPPVDLRASPPGEARVEPLSREPARRGFLRGLRRPGGGNDGPSEALAGRLDRSRAAEIRAEEITAWFGDHKVLDRVSLVMPAGRVTSLIGPSGCGKSTFLRILNRMHELVPSASLSGRVILDEQDIYAPNQRVTHARRKIGMVFQKPNPFPAMSIYENTVAALDLTGLKASKEEKDFLVEDSLKKASLWEEVKDRLHMPGGGLSGGQQQRLCIARAMAIAPEVLLMDEPCSALDPTSTRRVEETIAELRGVVTIVIVTHNMQQAARVSDRCAFFLAAQNTPGVIVEYGDTESMFSEPQDPRTHDYVNGRFG
jgi:phosphate transport system ATP-binding protein